MTALETPSLHALQALVSECQLPLRTLQLLAGLAARAAATQVCDWPRNIQLGSTSKFQKMGPALRVCVGCKCGHQ